MMSIWSSSPTPAMLFKEVRAKEPNEAKIIKWLRSNPSLAQERNMLGLVPLESLCRFGSTFPKAVLQSLWECNPETHALHQACQNKNITLEAVQLLVEQRPESVEEVDESKPWSSQLTPLHLAILKNLPPDILRFLFETYPKAVEYRDADGHLALSETIWCLEDVKLFQEIVLAERDVLKEPSTIGGQLVLHRLCAYVASSEIVEWVVEQYPTAVRTKSDAGLLPHHLVRDVASAKCLIRVYPEGLGVPDNEGNLPLHRICHLVQDRESDEAASLILYVAHQFQESVLRKNEMGETPVDIANCTDYGSTTERIRQGLISLEEEQKQERLKGWDERLHRLEEHEGRLHRLEQHVFGPTKSTSLPTTPEKMGAAVSE